jgi:hypothetical protein
VPRLTLKRLIPFAAVAVVAAACGGGGSGNNQQIGSADLLPPSTTTPAAAAAGPAPTSRNGSPATVPAQVRGTLPPHVETTIGSNFQVNLPNGGGENPALGGTGDFAGVLLAAKPATSIVMQFLEQSGVTPNSGALTYVRNMLHKVSGKPVTISAPIPIPGGATNWTPAQLDAMADRYGTKNQAGGSTAYIHYVFVHGSLGGNSDVLGVAIRGDVEAIFVDGTNNSPSLNTQRVLETIYTHETGHILGLVDEWMHDGRADPTARGCGGGPPCHSPDQNSVMYYAVDSAAAIIGFGPEATPIDFDAADYADLNAIHNGAPKGSHV